MRENFAADKDQQWSDDCKRAHRQHTPAIAPCGSHDTEQQRHCANHHSHTEQKEMSGERQNDQRRGAPQVETETGRVQTSIRRRIW